nr:MATE family efflux transporter [Shimazuella soli]
MAFLAHLGTAAISGVAATAIINFFFVSIDKNGLKAVTGRLVGQSTSDKLANLPPYLQRVKEKAKGNRGEVLVKHITYNSLFSSLLLGLMVGSLAIAFPIQILEWGGAEHTVAVYGAPYFQIIMGCVVFNSIANGLASTLNGLKETKRVTVAAVCMFFTQVTLGFLAVHVFDFGLKGVAWANVTANVVQVVILTRMLYHKGFSSRVSKLLPDWRFLWGTCKEAWPLMFEKLSFQACIASLWHVLQHHGMEVMASQRIANQITLVPLALFTGLYPVITPFVSEYFGNKDYKSIRSFTTGVLLVGTLCCGSVLMVTYFVGPWVTTLLFTDDKSLVEMTQMWLLFLVFTHMSNTALQIVTYSLKAVGSNKIISISSLVSNGTWGISLYMWGSTGNLMLVSSFQVVATLMKLIVLGWFFYTQRWVPKPKIGKIVWFDVKLLQEK